MAITSRGERLIFRDLLSSHYARSLRKGDLTALWLAATISKELKEPVNSLLLFSSILLLAPYEDSSDSGSLIKKSLSSYIVGETGGKLSGDSLLRWLNLQQISNHVSEIIQKSSNSFPDGLSSTTDLDDIPVDDELDEILGRALILAAKAKAGQTYTRHILGSMLSPLLSRTSAVVGFLTKRAVDVPHLRRQLIKFAHLRKRDASAPWKLFLFPPAPPASAVPPMPRPELGMDAFLDAVAARTLAVISPDANSQSAIQLLADGIGVEWEVGAEVGAGDFVLIYFSRTFEDHLKAITNATKGAHVAPSPLPLPDSGLTFLFRVSDEAKKDVPDSLWKYKVKLVDRFEFPHPVKRSEILSYPGLTKWQLPLMDFKEPGETSVIVGRHEARILWELIINTNPGAAPHIWRSAVSRGEAAESNAVTPAPETISSEAPPTKQKKSATRIVPLVRKTDSPPNQPSGAKELPPPPSSQSIALPKNPATVEKLVEQTTSSPANHASDLLQAYTSKLMTVQSKVRIYDLAKELKLESKHLIEEARREGADVSLPSNTVSKELAEKIRNKYFPKKESVAPRAMRVVKKAPVAAEAPSGEVEDIHASVAPNAAEQTAPPPHALDRSGADASVATADQGAVAKPAIARLVKKPLATPARVEQPAPGEGAPATATQTETPPAEQSITGAPAAKPTPQDAPDPVQPGTNEAQATTPPASVEQTGEAPLFPVAPGASAVAAPPPPTVPTPRFDPANTTIQQMVTQVFNQSIERKPETYSSHTLDIHLTPRLSSLEAEQTMSGVPRKYQVVLALSEVIDGQPQISHYEGPLLLDRHESGKAQQHGENNYGKALHAALFHDEPIDGPIYSDPQRQHTLGKGYVWGMSRRAQNQKVMRVQLRINTQAPELHAYRWEFLMDSVNGVPMACDKSTPFTRVLHVSSGVDNKRHSVGADAPLRVLAVMSSPADLASGEEGQERADLIGLLPLDPAEMTALREGLGRIGRLIEPLSGDNVLESPKDLTSMEAIRQRLRDAEQAGRPFTALHLLCHSIIRPEDGKSYLVLTDNERGRAALVSEERFAEMLRQFLPDLRLVVLASCFTASMTRGGALQGVARRLVSEGLPAVVAMQDALEFNSAQHFSQRLYSELIRHGEIDCAVNAARRELYDRRRVGPREAGAHTVGPRQWGAAVLFMRIPDGRLFDVEEDAGWLTDSDFTTQARAYEDMPGSDPKRLATQMLNTVVGAQGFHLTTSVPSLAQVFREAMETVRASAPPRPAEEDTRLFTDAGQKSLRWRLIEAVAEHRRHPLRRDMLFLRRLARAKISHLVEEGRLESMTPEEFSMHIWQGGNVTCGTRKLSCLLDGGPESGWLDDEGQPLNVTSAEWRDHFRGFTAGTGDLIETPYSFTGNLTWGEDGRAHDPAQRPDATALRRLIYNKVGDFEVFASMTAEAELLERGLDERTASLLLHAVSPDLYLPYHSALAAAIIRLLWPQGASPFKADFKDYCALAARLVADDDLGFEDLADVAYFFQRIESGRITLNSGDSYPDDLRVAMRSVLLDPARIESEMVVRSGALEQIAAAMSAGKNIILTGPPGTGKTTLAESLCRHARDHDFNRGHMLVTAVTDWTTFDTIGGYVPESREGLVFRPGIFLNAIESNKWLIIDEINRADIDKAFGELFTVLSGQAVTLPYKDEHGRTVRILPPGHPTSPLTRDYAIHPSWRIIGTMNVYDKASLFAMSYAFMRRFAFIDVDAPDAAPYRRLVEHFLRDAGLESPAEMGAQEVLLKLFDPLDALMRWRALGPAIAKDIVRYLHSRTRAGNGFTHTHLAEALLLYVVPQFDGLERDSILEVNRQLLSHFGDEEAREMLSKRIRSLFPYIPVAEWDNSEGV